MRNFAHFGAAGRSTGSGAGRPITQAPTSDNPVTMMCKAVIFLARPFAFAHRGAPASDQVGGRDDRQPHAGLILLARCLVDAAAMPPVAIELLVGHRPGYGHYLRPDKVIG
jgi:hypothetical protein